MGRTPIEKWSRGELEDNYHGIAEQMTTLKKTKGRLENELKM
jgi:hypothetical protein